MERISHLTQSLTASKTKHVDSSLHYFGFDQLLGEKATKLAHNLRQVLESGIYPLLDEYVEAADYPEKVVEIMKAQRLAHYAFKGEYGCGATSAERVAIILELARINASAATLYLVQTKLIGRTIELYGSEEQKAEYLPKLRDFDLVGSWGLTELDNGSDASGLTTNVRFEDGEYILNGNKRWIGNANKDLITVFARNQDTNEIECFILHLDTPGVQREKIEYKMALRSVQNMQLFFQEVRIPAKNKLPGVKGFASIAVLLAESRLSVAWLACGVGLGLYDSMMKYLTEREQFGKKLVAYQLIQDKVFRVMSAVQASLLMAFNAQRLLDEGKASIGQLAMVKAYCTDQIRNAARLAREALGGNGIIMTNRVITHLMDMEAVYTYEGTYDINTLVCARELTGVAAFKMR